MKMTVGKLIEKLRQYPRESYLVVSDSDDNWFDISAIDVAPDDEVCLNIDTAARFKERKVCFDPIETIR